MIDLIDLNNDLNYLILKVLQSKGLHVTSEKPVCVRAETVEWVSEAAVLTANGVPAPPVVRYLLYSMSSRGAAAQQQRISQALLSSVLHIYSYRCELGFPLYFHSHQLWGPFKTLVWEVGLLSHFKEGKAQVKQSLKVTHRISRKGRNSESYDTTVILSQL